MRRLMRVPAGYALGTVSAAGVLLCGVSFALGLVIVVAAVRAHDWLEGESPAT